VATACHKESVRNTGSSKCGHDDQPDAREGQAGRPGWREVRSTLKPVMPVREGPQFKTDATMVRIGDWQPINSENCSELQKRCTRSEAEAGYRFTPCTQDQPRRHPGACLCQCRSKRRTRVDGQTSRTSRRMGYGGGLANWRLLSGKKLTTEPHQKSVHTQGQRQTQAAGHLDRAGSGLHDSSNAGAGTDLRSRPSTRTVRVPSRRNASRR